jgi:hypothetical protein
VVKYKFLRCFCIGCYQCSGLGYSFINNLCVCDARQKFFGAAKMDVLGSLSGSMTVDIVGWKVLFYIDVCFVY